MERLTHERTDGEGYWSPHKRAELIRQLARYENSGLTPAEVRMLAAEHRKEQTDK